MSSAGDGHFDVPIQLSPWTGFAGITSHTREFFITTESPQSPHVEVLQDSEEVCSVRYGPLIAASWQVFWILSLAGEELRWEVDVRVGRKTLPDAEINLLAFDVLEGEEITEAAFDTGYILPPKDWFAVPRPEVTYAGNEDGRGILDRRVRLKFHGDGHDTLYLTMAGGYGLSLTCGDDNLFRIVPKVIYQPSRPRDSRRLPPARFKMKSEERIAIGTPQWQESETIAADTTFHAAITVRAYRPRPVDTMKLTTPDEAVARRTIRFHRTHAHGSIAHRWGFAGGWHNTGCPDAHSVSFEYYMHGKAHFYGLHPAIDQLMANAIDSVYERETHANGLIWQHSFMGRGIFCENNASMLIFLADYVRRTGDLSRLYCGERWADYILAHCTDDPFLYFCSRSTGIPGHGRGAYICNWWDVVGCGGHDGFINVLTYPGLRDLGRMERAAGRHALADRYTRAADRFRQAFNELFWDDRAGRYISWVDAEGGRHDYFFTSINLIAAYEGIADEHRRQRILEGINGRLGELGYKGCSLPGNLISIPPEHYNAGDWWLERYGYPHFYDEFGIYENGGVWPWVSAYYIAAMAEWDPDVAYEHYLAILDQYDRDNLQGAGNGYFWDPRTGEMMEGSRQEPYLANTAMTIWGFMAMFGLEFNFSEGIRIRPRLPGRLAGSRFDMIYHGRRISWRFAGWGTRVVTVHVDNEDHSTEMAIAPSRLKEGSRIEVHVGE